MFGFDPGLQPGLELLGECAGLVVLGAVLGSDDDLAEVAKINFVDPSHRRLCVVAPFCASQAGEKVLSDSLEDLWWNLELAIGFGFGVLLFDLFAKTGDAISQDDPCEWLLLFGKATKDRVSVGPLRSQSLWLRACGAFGAFSAWSVVSLLVAATSVVAASSTLAVTSATTIAATSVVTASSVVTVASTLAVTATTTSPGPAASTLAVTSATTAPVTVAISTAASTAALFDELGSDSTFVLARSENVECLGARRLGLGRHNRSDEHSVHCELSIHTYDVADPGTLVEKRTVQFTLGLLCACGSPGIAAVITFAC